MLESLMVSILENVHGVYKLEPLVSRRQVRKTARSSSFSCAELLALACLVLSQ